MLFTNEYQEQRLKKVDELRELGINPYVTNSKRDTKISEFFLKNSDLLDAEIKRDENRKYIVVGRIKFFRLMGKASFLKIEDESGVLQVYVAKEALSGEFYDKFKKLFEVGDYVEAYGYPFVTQKGELSLHIDDIKILTKAINPLPEKYHGIVDKEARYRQRYVDLIMNPDVKDVFKMRSKIVSLTRRFFEDNNFLEVETPMMHPIAGGANARPFVTHHNALDVEKYLRIAPELYLKRLIVGGFEAVFEINRNFRNEGMDATHNPEFTMIEFYWAYKTYNDLMNITENLFAYLFDNLNLPKVLEYDGMQIDFSTPFKRVGYLDSLVEIGELDRDIIVDRDKILSLLKSKNIKVKENMELAYLQAELFDEFVESKLINPTFVVDFPIGISPLARRSDENSDIAERFELFIAGREIANGFNELNDPIDQYYRFKAQVDAKDLGDDEAHSMDEDYVNALGFGMAPTAGEGIGIDRLVMLLTNQHSIRDVILFPAMR